MKKKTVHGFNSAHHAKKADGGTTPHILNPGTSLRWVVSFRTGPIRTLGKSVWNPRDKRVGGRQCQSRPVVFKPYSVEPCGSVGDFQGFRQHISFIMSPKN